MTPEFNQWWDSDELTQTNPYREGSPMFWAWEGWLAGARAERESCAKFLEQTDILAAAIRTRGEK